MSGEGGSGDLGGVGISPSGGEGHVKEGALIGERGLAVWTDAPQATWASGLIEDRLSAAPFKASACRVTLRELRAIAPAWPCSTSEASRRAAVCPNVKSPP